MPECEICGRQAAAVFEVNVDGAQMLVCESCARGKQVVHGFGHERGGGHDAVRAPTKETEELIENYGMEIRKARERLGLPLVVLAERMSEKESTLARIEKEKTLPSEKTRVKLEKELGIKLLAKSTVEKAFIPKSRNESLTLGDLAKKEDDE